MPENIDQETPQLTTKDLLPPVETPTQADELIDESNKILYKSKNSVNEKIEMLQTNLDKFKEIVSGNPSARLAKTQSMLKNKDTPINVKSGYSEDLDQFFNKVNSPPSWRAMSN